MKELTIQVPDKKFKEVNTLLKRMRLNVKVKSTKRAIRVKRKEDGPTKEEILKNLEESVKELNLVLAGKKKALPLKDFLNEL
jgi:hypothetical protein